MQLTFTLGRGRAMWDKRYAVHVGRFVVLTSLFCVYAWSLCYAQDASQATPPGLLKGLFENNKVKVTEIHMEPGFKSKMHTHAEPRMSCTYLLLQRRESRSRMEKLPSRSGRQETYSGMTR